jgi:Fe-S oxidoreductase
MKSEFLHQYQKSNGIPLRSKIFTHFYKLNALGYKVRALSNLILGNQISATLLKKIMGIHPNRSFPKLNKRNLRSSYSQLRSEYQHIQKHRTVYLFVDEFTHFNDEKVGIAALRLLFELGYDVKIANHQESGRAAISKGLLTHAVRCANKNVMIFQELVTKDIPLIGIEPSAILTFKDEYPRLVDKALVSQAKALSENVYTIESFLYHEVKKGYITADHFNETEKQILLHGHCHQKALTDINEIAWLLSLPKHHIVEIIPSGCCGMAGSFGYEKEHYEVSMQIGELVLFPAIRAASSQAVIAASGTSCRHQILDGTGGIEAKHVAEILYEALKSN